MLLLKTNNRGNVGEYFLLYTDLFSMNVNSWKRLFRSFLHQNSIDKKNADNTKKRENVNFPK